MIEPIMRAWRAAMTLADFPVTLAGTPEPDHVTAPRPVNRRGRCPTCDVSSTEDRCWSCGRPW